jgi:hypothetical protein
MPIIKEEDWNEWVTINTDGYGAACVEVAREVMRLLDERPGDFDPDAIINEADQNIKAGGITGFMAGCVAQMVSHCHSRGEEFRRKWNISNQIHDEGEKANEGKGVLNPALVNIKT